MNNWMDLMNSWNGRSRQRHWTESNSLSPELLLLGGIGLGMGLMYMLDPDRGRRRRALLRDKLVHANHVLNNAASTTARDLGHRASGLWAEGQHLFEREEVAADVLTARVRAHLGRVVSHPHAVQVSVEDGRVTLRGPVLADEVDELLCCVAKVRGVNEVENLLTVHQTPDGVSGLQGGRPRPGSSFALMQSNWSPTIRLFAGVAGGALTAWCLKRRDALGATLGTAGFGLLLRGLTNMEMKSLVGVGGDCRALEVHKTININAPVEQVYAFWTNYQNFPRFMANVREVRPTANGRSHWTVAGPGGVPISWTAKLTEQVPNRLLAWETVPGSRVSSSGTIHFDPNPTGGTRVQIKLCYHPPGGALGHALAKFFGSDPRSEMDADLVRMKTLIETGHPPHDATNPLPTWRAAELTHASAR
jgi:uncharacterized membrane protein